MEIHAPHKPINSVKEFFIHIFTITVGILIALGMEQAATAYHHHDLAENARANILSELRDNARSLNAHLKNVEKRIEEHRQTLAVLDILIARKPISEFSMNLGFDVPTLLSTSWNTAESTGALAYMDYNDVKRFAGVHDTQQMLIKIQDELSRAATDAMGMIAATKDPAKLSTAELIEARQSAQHSLTELTIWGQIASQLGKEYAAVLKGN
jgi:hypothetical protein